MDSNFWSDILVSISSHICDYMGYLWFVPEYHTQIIFDYEFGHVPFSLPQIDLKFVSHETSFINIIKTQKLSTP